MFYNVPITRFYSIRQKVSEVVLEIESIVLNQMLFVTFKSSSCKKVLKIIKRGSTNSLWEILKCMTHSPPVNTEVELWVRLQDVSIQIGTWSSLHL